MGSERVGCDLATFTFIHWDAHSSWFNWFFFFKPLCLFISFLWKCWSLWETTALCHVCCARRASRNWPRRPEGNPGWDLGPSELCSPSRARAPWGKTPDGKSLPTWPEEQRPIWSFFLIQREGEPLVPKGLVLDRVPPCLVPGPGESVCCPCKETLAPGLGGRKDAAHLSSFYSSPRATPGAEAEGALAAGEWLVSMFWAAFAEERFWKKVCWIN